MRGYFKFQIRTTKNLQKQQQRRIYSRLPLIFNPANRSDVFAKKLSEQNFEWN